MIASEVVEELLFGLVGDVARRELAQSDEVLGPEEVPESAGNLVRG